MVKRAALILSGGKGRRFQTQSQEWQDKALAQLRGKPMLIHAIENAQGVVDEIAVCVNDQERKNQYDGVLKNHGVANVKIIVDEKIDNINGPNVAIMSGLKSTQADYCLTLPCDMPFLEPKVAEFLFKQAKGENVVVPMWPNGRLETLLMVLERKSAMEISETLCILKRPRSDDIPRGASRVLLVSPLKEIKTLDPDLKSFVNINSKEDFMRPQTRHPHGTIKKNLQLNLGVLSISNLKLLREGVKSIHEKKVLDAQKIFAYCASNFELYNSFFWTALTEEKLGETLQTLSLTQSNREVGAMLDSKSKEEYLRAAKNYRAEGKIYESYRCCLLAERALADTVRCESRGMGKVEQVHRWPKRSLIDLY